MQGLFMLAKSQLAFLNLDHKTMGENPDYNTCKLYKHCIFKFYLIGIFYFLCLPKACEDPVAFVKGQNPNHNENPDHKSNTCNTN